MSEPPSRALMSPADRRALLDQRERVIAQLSELFAGGTLEMDEFERRLDEVHRAASSAEVLRCVEGLTAPAHAAPLGTTALVPAEQAPAAKQLVAVFGSVERRGGWQVPRHLGVRALFGNVELDLREARLPAGSVEIEVSATFGNVEIVVPPQLAVETEGSGLFGNFEQRDRAPADPDPGAPVVRVRGRALFGNIEIQTRLPGDRGPARRR